MNIKQITRVEEEMEKCNYKDAIKIQVDDNIVFDVHDGEFEDNDLGRNFSDCYNIVNLMEQAYLAGK